MILSPGGGIKNLIGLLTGATLGCQGDTICNIKLRVYKISKNRVNSFEFLDKVYILKI